FTRLLQSLQSHLVLAQIDSLVALELISNVVNQCLVEVIAAEVRIAIGGDDSEHTVGHFENRHVECAAPQVEYADLLLRLFVESVSQRGCRGFVDNTSHFQARDLPSVFGRLTLRIIKVCGYG